MNDAHAKAPSRRLLYLIADEFPTHRADVTVLFGKELLRHGIASDLVTQRSAEGSEGDDTWPAGTVLACPRSGNRMRNQLSGFWHDCRALWRAGGNRYDAIQVRDKVFAGIVGLVIARLRGLPFFFWMSFPISEASIVLARREGLSLGLARWVFVATKGYVGKFLFYRFLLPRCNHVFVQSERMVDDVARHGIGREHMTPVPMGVDLDRVAAASSDPEARRHEPNGPLVIGYLGTLDRSRRLDFLFEVLVEVRRRLAGVCLLLVGEATEVADRRWLEARARELGVDEAITWTGWLPTLEGWRSLRRVDVAVSLFPRGELLDSASPTKVGEYLALGLPVVANDQPDQQKVLSESGAGLSVAMNVSEFADAVLRILCDPVISAAMRAAGPPYVAAHRSYTLIGKQVADVYNRLLRPD